MLYSDWCSAPAGKHGRWTEEIIMGRIDHIQEVELGSWYFQGFHWRSGWQDQYCFQCALYRVEALARAEGFY